MLKWFKKKSPEELNAEVERENRELYGDAAGAAPAASPESEFADLMFGAQTETATPPEAEIETAAEPKAAPAEAPSPAETPAAPEPAEPAAPEPPTEVPPAEPPQLAPTEPPTATPTETAEAPPETPAAPEPAKPEPPEPAARAASTEDFYIPHFEEDSDDASAFAPVIAPEFRIPEEDLNLFERLRSGLDKTQRNLTSQLMSAIGLKRRIDEELIDDIEDILLQSDVGVRSTDRIVAEIRKLGERDEVYEPEELALLVKDTIADILAEGHRPLELKAAPPAIILVVGVNGTGKTTTIGKLALEYAREGKSCLLIAADTFRAAATEQLTIWAERVGAGIVTGKEGADPASVCYEGLEEALKVRPDVVLIDTAGRLHTKTHLMNELGKVVRVIQKLVPDAPHETVIVLDATTGQNALQQVGTFGEVVDLTGVIMTKLDGSAKGGILIAIKEAHPELPIFKIGIGEGPEDLRDFSPRLFAEALFAPKVQS